MEKYVIDSLKSDYEEIIKYILKNDIDISKFNLKNSFSAADYENYISYLICKNKNYQELEKMIDNQKIGKTNDYGLDILILNKKTNKKIGIQCKKYSKNISNNEISGIIAAKLIYKLDFLCVIASQQFNDSAQYVAKINNVLLIQDNEIIKFYENFDNKL